MVLWGWEREVPQPGRPFTRASWAEVLPWGGVTKDKGKSRAVKCEEPPPESVSHVLGEYWEDLIFLWRSYICEPCLRTHGLKESLKISNLELWDCHPHSLIFQIPRRFSSHLLNIWLHSAEEQGHIAEVCVDTHVHAEPRVPKGSGATKANDTDCELWTDQSKTHSWHEGLWLDFVFYLTSYIQISLLHLSVFVEKTKPQTLKSCPICMAHFTSVRETSEGSLINYNRTIILNSLPPSATTAWGFRKLLSG